MYTSNTYKVIQDDNFIAVAHVGVICLLDKNCLSLAMSATEMNILQPGQIIRPQVTEEQAVSLVECLYGLKVTSIKQMNSYDDRNYYIKVADSVNNPHISQLWPHGYVLKVLNSMDSQRKHVGMYYLCRCGIYMYRYVSALQ